MKKPVLVLAIVLMAMTTYAYQGVFPVIGAPEKTYQVTVTDTAKTLIASVGTNFMQTAGSRPKNVVGVIITCETYNIRFTLGSQSADPSTTFGHILYSGQSLRLANPTAIQYMKIINAETGKAAVIHVTPEY